MATAPATPDNMTLDRTDGSATTALYRAALGPVHTDYYLKAFTHFDASGKTGPLWNWNAALLTLNWLLFRQLWVAALAYTGALVAAALLLVGIARLVFQVSAEVQWLLAGSALLLAVGLPGFFGSAWLYAACNKKMERALVASATLEEACAALAAKAAGRKRMAGLLAGNLVLSAVLAVLVFFWPDSHSLPFDRAQATHTVPVESLHSGLAPPTTSRTSQGMVQPAATAAPAALAAQPSAMPVATAATATAVASAPSVAVQAPAAVAAVAMAPAPSAVTVVAATPDNKHRSARQARADKAAKLAEKRLQAKKDKAAKATATAAVPAAETFLINVGLFADANNARNAVAKLQDAGLPAQSQPIRSAKGARTRVRVGPFETRVEAERVAEKIRALQLDALVFKP